MSNQESESTNSKVIELAQYFSTGRHAFAASDDATQLDLAMARVLESLGDAPNYVIDCRESNDLSEFAREVDKEGIGQLIADIGVERANLEGILTARLANAMDCFRDHGSQGYLILNHVDSMINLQNTFEMEGAFRGAMQFHDDIAVLWLGSKETIIDINQDDRPFYLSFRIFWL